MGTTRSKFLLLAFLLLMTMAGCAAGDQRFIDEPAGFWAGLWHGIILVIAFIISLFNDTVLVYQANNAGNIYNLGFVLGVLAVSGGGTSFGRTKKKARGTREDWDRMSGRVEAKVKSGIKCWLEESERDDSEWREIGAKIEEKIKRELRKWAEDEK